MENQDPIVIVGSARTPLGELLGIYSTLQATNLGGVVIKAAMERAKLTPKDIENIVMGCVLQAGLGQAPARQAALNAGLPTSVKCMTINKVCGSGMQAIMTAQDLLVSGRSKVVIAGGMESMSHAPYLLNKARGGYRLGHAKIIDEMLLDGLEDAYETGTPMGVYADRTAEKYRFTRKEQDEFSLTSLTRAKEATKNGWFLSDVEIIPTLVKPHKGEPILIKEDEHPNNVKVEKIPTLKAAFTEGGTVTAANSSSISDGAAALVLMHLSEAKKKGHKTHRQNIRPVLLLPRSRLVYNGTRKSHRNATE